MAKRGIGRQFKRDGGKGSKPSAPTSRADRARSQKAAEQRAFGSREFDRLAGSMRGGGRS